MTNDTLSISPKQSESKKRMVPIRYVLAPFLIVFAAILFLLVMKILAPKPAKKIVEIKAPLVEVIEIKREDITFNITSQGSVSPSTKTPLISEVSGNIIYVSDKFDIGGYFKKGDKLLEIDDILYKVALLKAQARLDATKALLVEEHARSQQSKEEWLLSGKELEDAPILALRVPFLQKAQAEVNAAKADLQEAQAKLKRTIITAPYDALVYEKDADIGQYISSGTKLASIFSIDYAEVRLPITQNDLEFLNIPLINDKSSHVASAELTHTTSLKTYTWPAEITRSEGVVSNKNRVSYVIAKVKDPYNILLNTVNTKSLPIGSFVRATITGKQVSDLIVIPRSALRGKNTLYLISPNNTLAITTIKILRSNAHAIYTSDQLPSDHKIITTKISHPAQDMTLRVKSSELIDKKTSKPLLSPTLQKGE